MNSPVDYEELEALVRMAKRDKVTANELLMAIRFIRILDVDPDWIDSQPENASIAELVQSYPDNLDFEVFE